MGRRLLRILVATLVMPHFAHAADCIGTDGGTGCVQESPAADARVCDVVFTAESTSRVSGLVFDAGYGDTSGAPLGSGEGVACETLLPGALGSYNDDESTSTLIAGILHVEGVEGRFDVAKCRFDASDGFEASRLRIEVVDAVNPYKYPISPAVFVGSIVCGTPEELDGNGVDEPSVDGAEDPAPTCQGVYAVSFAVSGDKRIGALQLTINYAAAPGEIAGSGQGVDCDADVDAVALFNDKDSVRTLKAGFVTLDGFQAPTDVITCRFESLERAPTASDFSITVEDAAVPEGTKIVPLPAVTVSSVVPVAGNGCGGPVCGNAIQEDGEQCDEGAANGTDSKGCASDCTLPLACGDSDGNGTVTATDASHALKQAVGLGNGCSASVCDVNGSGTVTATDARMILDVSVGRNVELACDPALIVSLDDDVELGGLVLTVDYSSASDAAFVGGGDEVECVSLLGDGALAAFNNDKTSRTLHAALVAVPSISGPTPLFACAFHPGSAREGDVSVHVEDAIAPNYATVSPPTVSVSW